LVEERCPGDVVVVGADMVHGRWLGFRFFFFSLNVNTRLSTTIKSPTASRFYSYHEPAHTVVVTTSVSKIFSDMKLMLFELKNYLILSRIACVLTQSYVARTHLSLCCLQLSLSTKLECTHC